MDARQANLHYALHCAKLGLYVFPCGADKKPLVKWRALSTIDHEQIKQQWANHPDAIPGIDLGKSNHIVIDGDRHGGPDGVVAVEQLFTEHNTSLTDAPGVITPRGGGRHSWFKQPNGKPLGNSDKPIRDLGINIRGAGGYVIAPGATLPDGRRYTRDKDTPNLFVALRENAVPPLPEWFVELVRPKAHHNQDHEDAPRPTQKLNGSIRHRRYAEAALDNLCKQLASTPERSRNIELNNAALRMGHMVASGWIERAVVERRLGEAAIAAGLTATEIRATLASGINAGLKDPHPELVDRPLPSAHSKSNDADVSSDDEPALCIDDFHAFMPTHTYIYAPSREMWAAPSVNVRLPEVTGPDGKSMPPSKWLDLNAHVEQMTWAPGLPMLIKDRLISEGGWIDRPGDTVFNNYRPPIIKPGNPESAGPWLDHTRRLFGESAEHIIKWFAQRVQHPEVKINHAIVLGGLQGIGKDTTLEPIKYAVGPWNFMEVSPAHLIGRFNGFVKSVILRINEARDLGDIDRFGFYDHLKAYTAAPPDVLRVDEKNLREYSVLNCTGVVITTNHKTDGIYLPPDDRRHFVAWSDATKDDFDAAYWQKLWTWFRNGGIEHVAAYLRTLDLSDFDPKNPPPKTSAFWEIVDASRAPEDAELADVIEMLGSPRALTIEQIARRAEGPFAEWLRDRKNARRIPYRLESCGYVAVRNDAAKDGLWKIDGRRQVIYAKAELSLRDRIRAAQRTVGI
jgi:hypothetical protein